MEMQKKSIKKKVISGILSVAVLLAILPFGIFNGLFVSAATVDWNIAIDGDLIIPGSSTDNYRVTGSKTGIAGTAATGTIDVASGYQGTITLVNVTITTTGNKPAIAIRGNGVQDTPNTKVTIFFEGNNYLHSGTASASSYGGIELAKGTELTLDGTGVLEARCSPSSGNSPSNDGRGVAIGGQGNIHIKGGTIKAYASTHGAAIGADGNNPFNGHVIVSGGNITAVGGGHGAGIGGGCSNTGAGGRPSSSTYGTGIVLVLPEATVTASGGNSTNPYLVGNVGTKVYIGDPSSPAVTVRTSENTRNADIYMDLRNMTAITDILVKFGLPPSFINTEKVLFGNTGATGVATLQMESGMGNNVNFYTEAKTNTTPALNFLAVEQAITGATNIILQAPVFNFTTTSNPATVPALTYGYTTVPSGNQVVVKIKNEGNAPVTQLTAVLDDTYIGLYDISGLDKTDLAVNEEATVTIMPKIGLPAGSNVPTLKINGKGVSGSGLSLIEVAMAEQIVPLATQVVTKKPAGAGEGGSVSAAILPDANFHNYASIGLTAAAGTGNNITSWSYAITTSNTPPGAGWISEGVNASATAGFPVAPADGEFHIHWKMENSNYTDTSGTISSYKLDRTVPTVTSINTTVSGAGAGNFDVAIKFSEDVSVLANSGLTITNGTVQSIVRKPATQDEFIVTLKANAGLNAGDKIKVQVNSGAVQDKGGNNNTSSSALSDLEVNFNSNSPNVTNYSFAPGQEFPAQQTSVNLTITPRGVANSNLFFATGGAQLVNGSATPFVTVNDGGIGGIYNATVSNIAASGDITITITGTFGTGDYTVNVAQGAIKNSEGNELVADNRTFKVRIPTITPPTIPGEINGNTFKMTPAILPSEGGASVATLYGEHLQFAGIIEINDPNATPTRQTMVVSGDGRTATYTAALPENFTPTDIPYVYDVYLNNVLHNAKAQATVEGSVPAIRSITAGVASGEIAISPLVFNNKGGSINLTVAGTSLQAFTSIEIKEAGNTYTVTSGATSQVREVSQSGVVLPSNPSLTDINYVFEVYADGAPTGITVTATVQGSYPNVVAANPDNTKLPAVGGSTCITISGIYLDNFTTLALQDNTNGVTVPVTVSADPDRTQATTAPITFPACSGGLRNDMHEFEIIADGVPTGITTTIEVGDSVPNYQRVEATPPYFPTVESTLHGKGQSTITLHGNYLHNFNSLQLWDNVYNRFYTFSNVEDMTASQVVKIPSAEGVHVYDVWIDGVDIGLAASVSVGIATGGLPPVDLEPDMPIAVLPYNENKHWVSRGGGIKGRGFTGREVVGFDLLEFQCEQEGKKNPESPVIIIPNIDRITREQLDLAASATLKGARESEQQGKGILTLWFDTTWADKPDELEGRLHISMNGLLPDLHPGVYVDQKETKEAEDLFRSRFSNKNLAVVSLGQHGKYGVRVEVVADIDLTAFNTKNLRLYRFDRVTGEYAPLEKAEHYIDDTGYLHFYTSYGDEIIITDTSLAEESGSFPVVKEK